MRSNYVKWLVPIAVTVAVSLYGWCYTLGCEQSRAKQELKDAIGLLMEVRDDVKELLKRK